jgi:hypothetical protein
MPYKSLKQERFFNANRSKLEKQGVDVGEWNSASKGMKLPESSALQKEKVHPLAKKKKNWIAGAIKHPGSLRSAASKSGESTKQFASEHKSDSGKTGKRSRLALTLMGFKH